MGEWDKRNYLISENERIEIEKELGRELQRIQERKIQANASPFTNEIRVTSWIFIQGLAPILMVVHLAHVPQPIAMLRNHIWSRNKY